MKTKSQLRNQDLVKSKRLKTIGALKVVQVDNLIKIGIRLTLCDNNHARTYRLSEWDGRSLSRTEIWKAK